MATMAAILKNLFCPSSSESKGQLTPNVVSGWLVDKNELKLFRSEIQDGTMVANLEIYFCPSPEPKGQFIW